MRWALLALLLSGCGDPASSPAASKDSGVVDSSADAPVDVVVSQNGARPKLAWAKAVTMGIPAALGIDGKGNLVVGEWPPNGSHPDAKVRGFDATGNPLWTAASKGPTYAFNSAGESIGGALDQVASSSWSLNVARVDDSGTVRFSKSYGKEVGIHFFDVGLDESGNGYLAGDFSNPLDFGAGPVTSTGDEPFVVELDPDAKPLWIQQFPKISSGIAVAVDSDGGLLLGGTSKGQDFGDGAIDGTFLVSLGSDHSFRWATRGGATGYVIDIVADGAGGGALMLTGKGASSWAGQSFDALGEHDFAVVSFDAAGKTRFIRRIAATSVVWDTSLAFSESGHLALSARTSDATMDLGQGTLVDSRYRASAYIGRYDASGAPVWTARYGDGGDCYLDGIAFASDDSIVVAGNTEGTVDLGGTVIANATGKSQQAFLAKLGP